MTAIEHAVPAYIPNGGPVLGWVKFEYPHSDRTEVVPCCTQREINQVCFTNRHMDAVRVELRALGGRP